MKFDGPLLIYNLFPRIVGNFSQWKKNLLRIKEMGFDWIYINPFHYPGFSGSLYAVKDYFRINPIFIDEKSNLTPFEQLKDFINEAHKSGLKLIMDLIINHTAKDHPFTISNPYWYKMENGKIKSPGAWDNGVWIEWGDLAEIDNLTEVDRDKLWDYWYSILDFYIKIGFDGFRADAAYAVPMELWDFLIGKVKEKYRDILFIAESLGCPLEETLKLAKRFDYIFNSSKWWNYKDSWLIDQYNKTSSLAPSISFPESHDTERLFTEVTGNEKLFKQRVLFTAFFSNGWMIPIGLEFGFRKRVNVVSSMPFDFEEISVDYTDFIKKIVSIKKKNSSLYDEGEIENFNVENEISFFVKKTKKDNILFVINNSSKRKNLNIDKIFKSEKFFDIVSNEFLNKMITLSPYDIKIIKCKK